MSFFNCKRVAKVIIPSSVTRIASGAFINCRSLVVNMANSVKECGDYAFAGCCSLTRVDIPDSVRDIGLDAFFNCGQLTLTAPARLLNLKFSNVYKKVAKECGCGRCNWRWFLRGFVCSLMLASDRAQLRSHTEFTLE